MIVALLAGGAYAGYLVGKKDAPPPVAASPSPCPTSGLYFPEGCTRPSHSPTPTKPRVEEEFPRVAVGELLSLGVNSLGRLETAKCVRHVLGGIHVYLSDCTDWQSNGVDAYLFYVNLWNNRQQPASIKLSNFSIRLPGGWELLSGHRPDGSRPRSTRVHPGRQLIAVDGRRSGWIAFDASIDFVPDRIDYFDGRQTLTVKLAGKHTISET